MKTPSEFAGMHLPAHLDEGEVRTIFRVFLLASVLMVTALVPFFLAINSASSEADTGEVRTAPSATMLSWAAKDDAEKQTYVIDGYTLTLSTHVHNNGERVAFLRVRAPRGESTSIHGQIGFPVCESGSGRGEVDFSAGRPRGARARIVEPLSCWRH